MGVGWRGCVCVCVLERGKREGVRIGDNLVG